MTRIDMLKGAVVNSMYVGRSGTLHLYFKAADGTYIGVQGFSPLVVRIPAEPKKRRRA